jgi:DNA-directed RNA polymerase specialized sigma24 family protein
MDCLDPIRTAAGPSVKGRPTERTGPPWRSLVDRCRDGDEGAWEEFVVSFRALAQRRLRQFHGLGPSDRADLASATLERLVVAVRGGHIRGGTDAEVSAYITRAVRNQALDLISRRRPETPLDDGDRHDWAKEGQAYERALMQEVTDIVSSWSPTERFLFVQKSHGVSSERIKQELEHGPYAEFIDVATVDTRYHRLRTRLRSRLEC